MNINQKGFANIILIVLVVILSGAMGYLVFSQKSFAPTPTPSPTQNPTPSPTPLPTPIPSASKYPSWIKKLIAEVENYPTSDPRVSLTQYEYKNQTVYYLPVYQCCDFKSSLYNANGDFICSPDGGFTGEGDGKCSDFFTTRRNAKVIWKDSR